MRLQTFWIGLLLAWLAIWLWTRWKSHTLKLKYFKFWGDVSKGQRADNIRGFGMAAFLLAMNIVVRLFWPDQMI